MKNIKMFEEFKKWQSKKTIEEQEDPLELAKKIMNNDSYKTLDDAIEDMYQALDYGVENDKDIIDFLEKYDRL